MDQMQGSVHLPQPSHLSPLLLRFLSKKFQTKDDLFKAPDLALKLQKQCSDLEETLEDLNQRLSASIAAYVLHSDLVGGVFNEIRAKLGNLKSLTSASTTSQDGSVGEGLGSAGEILSQELPALAKEVARVETVRVYAETALELDTLIGDVEDAVSSSLTGNLRKTASTTSAEEMRLLAIKSLKQTEDVLTVITKSRPQWMHLVTAVDHRVDRALAVLRPQAIADHRALLNSLGWPPPLTSNFITSDRGKSSELLNPLFMMQGDLKSQYCENFLALCNLQELQRRRKSRQLKGYNREVALHQPLWAIEELVNPVSLVSQRHFSKWIEKPEFIFALVYKIIRDFVESMDEVLQPLVDKARLAGYSCREEWVSAMVTSLSTYLAKEVFPIYIGQLQEDTATDGSSRARISWLNLVDLMISFDKRIQSLVANSGVLVAVREDENFQRISSLSAFCDRPDWLEIWAEIELGDVLGKLKPEMEDEKSWKTKMESAVLSLSEDYKSPAISGSVLRHLSLLIDRCRPLPSITLRAQFIRLAATPVLREFLECLLRRCQEAEGLTALADDDALIKVAISINAARYCEATLKEWCEDVFFLEMAFGEASEMAMGSDANVAEIQGSCIFEAEIEKLKEFHMEWVEKISTVVLRGFDARCRDYLKNKKQWQEKGEGWTVSQAFVDALDYLRGKISKLEGGLNEIDFVGVWRSLAGGVDQLVFNGILMNNAKFYDGGVARFGGDLEVLFGVFGAWCLRPEGFFAKVSEGLRLLKMEKKKQKEGLERGKDRWLRENGISHLTVAEAEKIMKNRVFMG